MRHVATALAVVAALVAGLWFFSGVVAPGYDSAIALGVGWFVVVGALTTLVARRRPDLRLAARGAFVVCAVAAVAGFLTSVRETTVDEPIEMGRPASSLTEDERREALPADPLAPQP